MIYDFQTNKHIMILLVEFIGELHLSIENRPEEEGEEDLRRKRHLKENSMPFPRLEKCILIFPIHEVFWMLFGWEEAEEKGEPGAHNTPIGYVARLPKKTPMKIDREYDLDCH